MKILLVGCNSNVSRIDPVCFIDTTDVTNTTVPVKKPHPPPKKPPTTDASSISGTTTSSSTSSSESTAGSVDNASVAGDGTGGSSSSHSSSSSTTTTGSSTTTSGTGSDGSSADSTVSYSEGALKPVGPGPARKNTMLLLGFAAAAGVAIAVATVPKRTVATPDHPLKGALTRRINMFSHLARHTNDPLARPPRRGDDGSYVNADEVMV